MADLWAEYGALAYAAIWLWTALEGETVVLLSAAWGRSSGLVNPWILFVVAWVGSFTGDQVWFWCGRRWGKTALRHAGQGTERRIEKALAMLERQGVPFILGFRFVYGIRNVASVACGLSGIPWRRFCVLNFIGAGLWSASFVSAGWYLAAALGEDVLCWFFGVVGAVVITMIAWRVLRSLCRRTAPQALPAAR